MVSVRWVVLVLIKDSETSSGNQWDKTWYSDWYTKAHNTTLVLVNSGNVGLIRSAGTPWLSWRPNSVELLDFSQRKIGESLTLCRRRRQLERKRMMLWYYLTLEPSWYRLMISKFSKPSKKPIKSLIRKMLFPAVVIQRKTSRQIYASLTSVTSFLDLRHS
jgi:hypothetical protein